MSLQNYLSNVPLADTPSEYLASSEQSKVDLMLLNAGPTENQAADGKAMVNAGSIVSFVNGLSAQEKEDVLYSTQFAQRAASKKFDRFTEVRQWYMAYLDMMENLGWIFDQLAFSKFEEGSQDLRMDVAAIKIIAKIASSNQLTVLQQTLTALEGLAENEREIELFDMQSTVQFSGNFQIGAVQRSDNGTLSVAMGAFHFKAEDRKRRFLFLSWGKQQANFWSAATRMSLNQAYYSDIRKLVRGKIGERGQRQIISIDI